MAKAIASYPKSQRARVVIRRLATSYDNGLGFQAALDAVKHLEGDDLQRAVQLLESRK